MTEENATDEESKEPKKPLVSRRRFLFGSGMVVGGAVASGAVAAAGVAASALTPAVAEAAMLPVKTEIIFKEAPTLQKAIGHVERDEQSCAGCRTCEAVCSLSHEGANSPSFARTWITDYLVEGHRIDGVTCKQCEGPECLYACPTGALHVDPATGARVINADVCLGCLKCAAACPQAPNAPIRLNFLTKKAIKCDLCGGDPLCVKYCPESSLALVKEV